MATRVPRIAWLTTGEAPSGLSNRLTTGGRTTAAERGRIPRRRSASRRAGRRMRRSGCAPSVAAPVRLSIGLPRLEPGRFARSEEHTSELQSRQYLVCRLLLEKNKKIYVVT